MPAWVYVVLSILIFLHFGLYFDFSHRALEAIETDEILYRRGGRASKISSVTELDYLKELVTRTVEYTEKNYRVTNRRISRIRSTPGDTWAGSIFLLLVYGVARVILFEYAACLGK